MASGFSAGDYGPFPMKRSASVGSDISDTGDSLEMEKTPSSAETSALEEVDGVQPELQKTARDSELSSKILALLGGIE